MSKLIVITDGTNTEYWRKLTVLCKSKEGFKYHDLKRLQFPFKYKGVQFDRVELNEVRGVEIRPTPEVKFISVKDFEKSFGEGLDMSPDVIRQAIEDRKKESQRIGFKHYN